MAQGACNYRNFYPLNEVVARIECNIMVDKNTGTNRMRYAKKVRLALALLIKMVALVAEVLWWNLDS